MICPSRVRLVRRTVGTRHPFIVFYHPSSSLLRTPKFEEFVASYQRKHSHNRQKDDPVTEMEQMFRRKRLDSDPGKAPQDSADDQKDDSGDSDDKAKTDK